MTTTPCAVAANTLFQTSRTEKELRGWYLEEQRFSAARAQVLTSFACRDAAGHHQSDYWHARAAEEWVYSGLSEREVAAARRARELQELQRGGGVSRVLFQAVPGAREVEMWLPVGPVLRRRPGACCQGGRPLSEPVWRGAAQLLSLLETPGSLDKLLPRLLGQAPSEERERNLVRQFCSLYEAGFLRRVGAAAAPFGV